MLIQSIYVRILSLTLYNRHAGFAEEDMEAMMICSVMRLLTIAEQGRVKMCSEENFDMKSWDGNKGSVETKISAKEIGRSPLCQGVLGRNSRVR